MNAGPSAATACSTLRLRSSQCVEAACPTYGTPWPIAIAVMSFRFCAFPKLSRPAGLVVVDAAVNSRFWPLYEVVHGRYRLTYEPERVVPVEEWLKGQARFAHLLRPENRYLVDSIQAEVDEDWRTLLERCA